jgi:secreted trypsin-like serine protease
VSIGILSRETSETDPCGAPSVYTDLGAYRSWIDQTLATGETTPNRHTATTPIPQVALPSRLNFLTTTNR